MKKKLEPLSIQDLYQSILQFSPTISRNKSRKNDRTHLDRKTALQLWARPRLLRGIPAHKIRSFAGHLSNAINPGNSKLLFDRQRWKHHINACRVPLTQKSGPRYHPAEASLFENGKT